MKEVKMFLKGILLMMITLIAICCVYTQSEAYDAHQNAHRYDSKAQDAYNRGDYQQEQQFRDRADRYHHEAQQEDIRYPGGRQQYERHEGPSYQSYGDEADRGY